MARAQSSSVRAAERAAFGELTEEQADQLSGRAPRLAGTRGGQPKRRCVDLQSHPRAQIGAEPAFF